MSLNDYSTLILIVMLIICHEIALFQSIFISALFLGMVMYVNEFKTKENQKLTGCKESQFYSMPFGQAIASMY